LPGTFPNFTLKELLQIQQLLLEGPSDILLHSHARSIDVSHKYDKYMCVNVFVGSKFFTSSKNKINFHWLLAHFHKGGQALLIRERLIISQALRAGIILSSAPPRLAPSAPILYWSSI